MPATTEPSPTDVAARYEALVSGAEADGAAGTVLFCVSTADLDEGKGDLYVAAGLAKALADRGWGVRFWPADRWGETPPHRTDVAIAMIESFVPGLLDPTTAVVAWVRNWTSAWASLPYLSEFDAVWASSEAAAERLSASLGEGVAVVPIGVDLDLFSAGRDTVGRDLDVVTTANFWGVERRLRSALDEVAEERSVVWFGANGEHLERSPRIDHRDRVSFFDLPMVYGRSRVVVDDVIAPASAFGTHNSRLFEALACGTPVVTNEARGLAELGLDAVPVYDDGRSLSEALDSAVRGDVGGLTDTVRERHSYARRAADVEAGLQEARVRAAVRTERSPMLRWAAQKQAELRSAALDRDGHLITVRRTERERDALRRELERSEARLLELTRDLGATITPLAEYAELRSSRAYAVLSRYRGAVARLRHR